MTKCNPENERVKRRYREYLGEAMRYSESSVDQAMMALHRFERYNKFKSFKAFHIKQAVAFKNHLAGQKNCRTGNPLSKATLSGTLNHLKKFFLWLAGQPGYKLRLSYADAEYFNLSAKDSRIAKATRERPVPSIEQILHVIRLMPSGTAVEKRNRALIAFTLLTGARDGATASLKMKHINLTEGCVYQDAREVNTKFSKTFTTHFFPVGDEVREIFEAWVTFLQTELLWGPDDPLFPKTKNILGKNHLFEASGLLREHWKSASPFRDIFKTAFQNAGLPYFNPHSFRHTLVQLGQRLCRTPEEFKAWSQNLGHEKVMTTFFSYGAVSLHRQTEIIRNLARDGGAD